MYHLLRDLTNKLKRRDPSVRSSLIIGHFIGIEIDPKRVPKKTTDLVIGKQ